MNLQDFLDKYKIEDLQDLVREIEDKGKSLPVNLVYQAAEYLNPNRDTTAAFYTDTMICQHIMGELPDFSDKRHIRILEPSVGAGNFIPFIAEKYQHIPILEIYLVDIDKNELKIAELIFETYYREKYPNIAIIYINNDYLKFSVSGKKFDLVIGNPPYAKVKDYQLVKEYKKNSKITKSLNLFVWFLEKAMNDGEWVSLIVPKSVLNAPEYVEIRAEINKKHIKSILDFGENGFKGVKIETVNLLFTEAASQSNTHVVSLTQKIDIIQEQAYITDKKYPTWLLYRNQQFDDFANGLELGMFKAFRDRQITSKECNKFGNFRVLRSRNIATNKIIDIPGYDLYLNDINGLAIGKYLNKDKIVCVPNLSYYPRACFLPKNCITDGSVALLETTENIAEEDLKIFETDEFREYYRIARNHGTRSLNIDSTSIYYFGIRRK